MVVAEFYRVRSVVVMGVVVVVSLNRTSFVMETAHEAEARLSKPETRQVRLILFLGEWWEEDCILDCEIEGPFRGTEIWAGELVHGY